MEIGRLSCTSSSAITLENLMRELAGTQDLAPCLPLTLILSGYDRATRRTTWPGVHEVPHVRRWLVPPYYLIFSLSFEKPDKGLRGKDAGGSDTHAKSFLVLVMIVFLVCDSTFHARYFFSMYLLTCFKHVNF